MKTRYTALLRTSLLLLAILFGTANATEVHQASAAEDRLIDLAALSLTPADLEEVGLDGFGVNMGILQSAEEYAASLAHDGIMSQSEAEAVTNDLGLRRTYTLSLFLPSEGGTFEDPETAAVWFRIVEVASNADAEEMFSATADDLASSERKVVEGTRRIGEDSIMSRSETIEAASGNPMSDLIMEFYTETYYGIVGAYDIARAGEFAAPAKPSIADVEALAEVLLGRIETAEETTLPTLSTEVLRLTTGDAAVETITDRYNAMDGTPFRRYSETDDVLTIRADNMERDQVTASYVVEQDIASGEELVPGDPHLIVRLFEFEDNRAAARYLDDSAFDRFATESYVSTFDAVDLPFEVGDSTIGGEYTGAYDGTELTGHVVWVQVDDVVARISLDASEPISIDVVEELVRTQADCLLGRTCESLQIPNDLV